MSNHLEVCDIIDYLHIPLGHTKYDICPRCRGGVDKDRSFAITRTKEGFLYICFRAKCGIKGFIQNYYTPQPLEPTHKDSFIPRHFYGELYLPDDTILNELLVRYGLEPATIKANRFKVHFSEKEGRYLWIPLYTHQGYNWGGILKGLDKGLYGKRKVVSYHWKDVPKIHLPLGVELLGEDVVLVEDALSATRLSQDGLTSVALLGTNLSPNMVGVLINFAKRIFVVLDSDTWEKGIPIKITDRYKCMFEEIIPIKVKKDIKDMDSIEYKKFLADTLNK